MIPPRRFRDQTDGARAPEIDARLARQLRVLAASPTVPRAVRAGAAPGRWGRRRGLLRWAMVAVLLVATAGGATAAVAYLVKSRDGGRTAAAPSPPPPPVARAGRSTVTRAAPVAATPPAEEPVASPAPAPSRRPQPEPSRRVARGVSARPEGEGQLTEEARLMGQALSALRQPGGGRAALEALDAYDARFPRGALAMEAAAARAEALLLVGDRKAALGILDRLPLGSGANVGRWLLLRAELRSAAGRCAEALVDFDGAWRGSTNADIRERSSAGRASCGARTR